MVHGTGGSPIEDISYLSRSEHRIPALVAMTERPRSRSELVEMTGVSSSTIRRTLREYEDRGWIQRVDYQYETTELGGYVALALAGVVDRLETEHGLRGIWDALPGAEEGFGIELCTDATITVADADHPFRPVNRLLELMGETEHFRFVGFEVALLEPCKDTLCERIIDGMDAEIINPPRVAKYIRSTCAELFSETLDSGNLTVHLHDDLPAYGVSIFDDRVAISGYDEDLVTVRALVDTDDEDARAWAESVYRTYRRETPTIPLEPGEG